MDGDPLDPLLERSTLKQPPAANELDTDEPSFASHEARHDVPGALRTPRTSSAHQHWRTASLISLLLLLIATLLLVPAENRAALLRALAIPTASPTAPIELGNDAFLWEHSVPWGQLLIDSKPGPDVRGPAVRQNAQGVWEGAAFHLPRGRHILDYRAVPFPPLVCVVSVPSAQGDTCPLDRSFDTGSLAPHAPTTRLLDLQATMRHLPTLQADALIAAAQTQLSALAAHLGRSALSSGDHFLDVTGDVVQVSTTVYVEPRFDLDTTIRDYDGQPCVTLCTVYDLVPEAASTQEWTVLAPVMPTWRYTTAAGSLLLAAGPATPIGAEPTTMVSLLTRWQDGAWQTPTFVVEAQQTDPVICPTAEQSISALMATPTPTPAPTTADQRFQGRFVASTSELGCLLAGSEADLSTGAPTGPMALVLYRAGALIAANAEAHRDFPTLPLASTHERALAQAVAPSSL
jgi:hypothetical protein